MGTDIRFKPVAHVVFNGATKGLLIALISKARRDAINQHSERAVYLNS